ncbi:MAG TPA: ABC transporter ATP-binding protein [Candidatus Marinimicrobia bacterium]|nr:ABC transporter ATP-binding protein [Candidatus Neomarinimicrobiota bacterium]
MKNENDKTLLTVKNLSKSYWNDGLEIAVLRNINLTVKEGEVVAIVGPSGIGKSTLLNLLGTLDRPDSGVIEYEGLNPFDLSDTEIARFRNTHIGFVFQFHHLLPEFTALENVMIPAMIYNRDVRKAEKMAREMLARVGLAERATHRPAALSGGERQRVAVARALINNPLIILADEPTGNLDAMNSELLIELMLELNRIYRRTFIIATHNQTIAEKSHRILKFTKDSLLIEASI